MAEPVSVRGRRWHAQARRAAFRVLLGAGVLRAMEGQPGDWDIVNLPFGGRVKVTPARNKDVQRRVWRWVSERQERRHWGAAVFFDRYHGSGFRVVMDLDEWAHLVGLLADLEKRQESER